MTKLTIDRQAGPALIIGKRTTIAQAILSVVNGGVILFNYLNPENPIPAGYAGIVAQPFIFGVQLYLVNRYGVTQ